MWRTEFSAFFNKEWSIWLLVGPLAGLFLMGLYFTSGFFIAYGERLLGTVMLEWVKEQNRNYTLSYEKASLSLIHNSFELSNLSLKADSTAGMHETLRLGKNLYYISVDRAKVDVSNIWNLYLNRALDIEGMEIIAPEITVYAMPAESTRKNSFSYQTADLYLAISKYIKSFEVEEFSLEHAKISFNQITDEGTRTIEITDASLYLEEFLFDEFYDRDSTKFFNTSAITLGMANQRLLLSDSLHSLTFDDLTISTTDKEIVINNLQISPNRELEEEDDLNCYHIAVPMVKLTDVDFLGAYHNNYLSIASIYLHRPDIEADIRVDKSTKGRKSSKSNSIVKLLGSAFDYLSVDELLLDSAAVDVIVYPNNKKEHISIDHLNLDITAINIADPASDIKEMLGLFEDLDLSVLNYRSELPDGIHVVDIQDFSISTSDNFIRLDSLSLMAKDTTNVDSVVLAMDKPVFNLQIPLFNVVGIDVKHLISNREFQGKMIEIPGINLKALVPKNKKSGDSNSTRPMSTDLYPYVKNYVSFIDLDEFKLVDAEILIERATRAGRQTVMELDACNLLAIDFALDSSSYARSDHIFNATDIELGIKGGKFSIPAIGHQFDISDFNYVYSEEKVEMGALQLYPLSRELKNIYAVGLTDLLISGANLRTILDSRMVLVDTIQFRNPEIIIRERDVASTAEQTEEPARLGDQIHAFRMNWVYFDNGTIKVLERDAIDFEVQDLYLLVKNLEFDPKALALNQLLTKFEDIELGGSHLGTFAEQGKTSIYVKDFDISLVDSTAVVNQLTISRNDKRIALNSGNPHTFIHVPRFNASGIDAHNTYFNRNLDIHKIEIDNPKLIFSQRTDTAKAKNDLVASLRNALDTLSINSVEVKNGEAVWTNQESGHNQRFEASGFAVAISDFYLDPENEITPDNLFFTRDISFSADRIDWNGGEGQLAIVTGEMGASTGDGSFYLRDLAASQPGANREKLGFKIALPALNLSEIDLYNFLHHQDLNLGSIEITAPDVVLTLPKPQNNGQQLERLALSSYPFNRQQLASIDIDHLELEGATLQLDWEDRAPVELNIMEIGVDNFWLHPDSMAADRRVFHADDIRASVGGYQLYTGDSLYRVAIGSAHLGVADRQLWVDSISLTPTLPRYEFSRKLGRQTDRMEIFTNQVRLDGLELADLLLEDKLLADKLTIQGLDMELFRDKNVPFPEDQIRFMPQHDLRRIPILVIIDSLELSDTNIAYHELNPEGDMPGIVSFTNLNGYGTNITNDSTLKEDEAIMTIAAQTNLMEEGTLMANFRFWLNHPNDSVEYYGAMSPMDLTAFNPALENLAFASIKGGDLKRFELNVEANDDFAQGEMLFYYDKLKVNLLNKQTHDTKKVGVAIASFFANTFVVRSKNPNIIPKKGDIFFVRDHQRSFFNYLSKSAFSGIITSVSPASNRKKIRQHDKEAKKKAKERSREAKRLAQNNR